MLGRLIGRQRWSWAAFGKHPATKDYFQIQLATPLAQAFSRWVETGFGRMSEDDRRHRVCSWRFWSRGLKKGALLGGLGRSSADGIGRPYPLMLLGEGTLGGWEENWHLLPFLLAPMWDRLEYAATRRALEINQLAEDLERMVAPKPEWKNLFNTAAADSMDACLPVHKLLLSEMKVKARTLAEEQKLIIPLDGTCGIDPMQMAGAWHQGLKPCFAEPPSTVFMGGGPDQSFLVFYTRPLVADDFTELWTLQAN